MAKQYVIFQKGLQPTEWEVACLKSFVGALGGYRIGREVSTSWLVIEFDGKKFEEVCDKHSTFMTLLTGWRQQGCIRRPHVKFLADETALLPKPPPEVEERSEPTVKTLLAKENDIHEAMGQAGLARHKRHQQMEAFSGLSKFVLPGLVLGGFVLTLFGYWQIRRVLETGNIQKNMHEQHRQVDALIDGKLRIETEDSEPSSAADKLEKPPVEGRE